MEKNEDKMEENRGSEDQNNVSVEEQQEDEMAEMKFPKLPSTLNEVQCLKSNNDGVIVFYISVYEICRFERH